MKGGSKMLPVVGIAEILWFGSVIGICAYLSKQYFEPKDLILINRRYP